MHLKHCHTAAAIAAALLISSCSTRRSASAPANYNAGTSATATPAQTFGALAGTYAPWTDVRMPVKLKITSPKNMSLSGTAQMINGVKLSVSLRFMGLMEVGRLYADKDSVIIVSKPLGAYCAESLQALAANYGLDISDLQCLLLGQAALPSSGAIKSGDASKFNIDVQAEDAATLSPKKLPANLKWLYTIVRGDDGTPAVAALDITANRLPPLACAYGAGTATPAGSMARSVTITAEAANKKLSATLTWDVSRAEWNAAADIDKPAIAPSLHRLSAAKALELLAQL